MDKCRKVLFALAVLGVADVATAAWGVLRGPFPVRVTLGAPTAYRNLYVHVPIAETSYALFTVALIAAILYLARGREKYYLLVVSSVVAGEIFSFFTIITGMAWASESWGAAWNWDPRETGVLLLALAYLGFFAVESSIADPERRRRVASSYAVAAYVMVPLSFAAPLIFGSLHPSFKEASSFLWTGNARPLMILRMILVMGFAILTAYLGSLLLRGVCRAALRNVAPVGILYIVALGIVALLLAHPYLHGETARVIAVGLGDGGGIEWMRLSTGENITFNPPLESPVKPSTAPDGSPSILGHIVAFQDGTVRVVVHWSVAFDTFCYALTVFTTLLILTLYSLRRASVRGGEGE